MRATQRTRRLVTWGVSAAAVAVAIIAMRCVPAEHIDQFQSTVEDLGMAGIALFIAVYVAASLALAPGSILTVMAGAVFGLWTGTAVVVVASNIAAMLGFAIARYVARDQVERLAARRPGFAAVDSAIAQGGWRIVGLLRLSPVIPFSLSNYLFGLTRVGFASYASASFAGMLPGTFVYVYLGYLGRLGVEGATWLTWSMSGAGLVATVVVTAYVTHLARAGLREHRAGPGD